LPTHAAATQQEQRELARLWLRAYAVKSTPRVRSPQQEDAQPELEPDTSTGDVVARRVARHAGRRRLGVIAAMLAALTVLPGWVAADWFLSRRTVAAGVDADSGQELLFSAACQPVVSMGDTDKCVREVQTLLARAGASDSVDGAFGPLTRGRVLAFQTLAGLPATGVVDEPTKRALYASAADLRVWSPAAARLRAAAERSDSRHDGDQRAALCGPGRHARHQCLRSRERIMRHLEISLASLPASRRRSGILRHVLLPAAA
jgi:hypothetical protein